MFKLLTLFFILNSISFNQADDVYTYLNKMINKNKEYKTVAYNFTIKQRIKEEYHIGKAFVKYQRTPLKIYYRQSYPDDGVEILFDKNKSIDKVLVNPNGFPWTSLNLSLQGSELRNNQHHSITEANFDYVYNIFEKLVSDYGKNINKHSTISNETEKINGLICKKIVLIEDNFRYKKYTITNEKSLGEIARKLYLNDYMILEKNNLSSNYDIKKNQTLIIPSKYAKKIIIYIDEKTLLPARLSLYDEKGLFEQLDYFNIKPLIKFKPVEFTKDYGEYGF